MEQLTSPEPSCFPTKRFIFPAPYSSTALKRVSPATHLAFPRAMDSTQMPTTLYVGLSGSRPRRSARMSGRTESFGPGVHRAANREIRIAIVIASFKFHFYEIVGVVPLIIVFVESRGRSWKESVPLVIARQVEPESVSLTLTHIACRMVSRSSLRIA